MLHINCFAAGTPMFFSPSESKPIEEFQKGDPILARDEENPEGPVEVKIVEEVFVSSTTIWELHVAGNVIRTTDEHPFYVLDKGWTPLKELQPGDYLCSHLGNWQPVEEVHDTGIEETVCNVRVSDYHTYFIGEPDWGFSVWAHNTCSLTEIRQATGNLLTRNEARAVKRHLEDSNVPDIDARIANAREYIDGLGRGIEVNGSQLQEIFDRFRVQRVNGRLPINGRQYAGRVYLDELPAALRTKYPHGVRFTAEGFAEFTPYATQRVRIQYTGSRVDDFRAANAAAGLQRTPRGYTWHHHHSVDGSGMGWMELVPTDLHDAVRHTGGVATWQELFPGLGEY